MVIITEVAYFSEHKLVQLLKGCKIGRAGYYKIVNENV